MKIIGESINTSIGRVKKALESEDIEYIQRLAKAQEEAGASYLDVNCGTRIDDEVEKMEWLVKIVDEAVNIPLCIDSPNPAALEKGLSLASKKKPIINSISAEQERYEAVIPLVKKFDAKIITLLLDDQGMPKTSEDRIRVANELIPRLMNDGISPKDIIVDPIVKPIGTGDTAALEVFGALSEIKEHFPEVHLSVGLSNISHGIPLEDMVNHAFLIMCIRHGLDFCIANALDEKLQGYTVIAEALAGKDPYCGKLLKAYRKGLFEKDKNYLNI